MHHKFIKLDTPSPKCQAEKNRASTSILKPSYPKRPKIKALEECHSSHVPSLQVKSCRMAFGTGSLKASGVRKLAAAGKDQVPFVHLTWHHYILARLPSNCSERHRRPMGLGTRVVAGGVQTRPPAPPDTPKPSLERIWLAGALNAMLGFSINARV